MVVRARQGSGLASPTSSPKAVPVSLGCPPCSLFLREFRFSDENRQRCFFRWRYCVSLAVFAPFKHVQSRVSACHPLDPYGPTLLTRAATRQRDGRLFSSRSRRCHCTFSEVICVPTLVRTAVSLVRLHVFGKWRHVKHPLPLRAIGRPSVSKGVLNMTGYRQCGVKHAVSYRNMVHAQSTP